MFSIQPEYPQRFPEADRPLPKKFGGQGGAGSGQLILRPNGGETDGLPDGGLCFAEPLSLSCQKAAPCGASPPWRLRGVMGLRMLRMLLQDAVRPSLFSVFSVFSLLFRHCILIARAHAPCPVRMLLFMKSVLAVAMKKCVYRCVQIQVMDPDLYILFSQFFSVSNNHNSIVSTTFCVLRVLISRIGSFQLLSKIATR